MVRAGILLSLICTTYVSDALCQSSGFIDAPPIDWVIQNTIERKLTFTTPDDQPELRKGIYEYNLASIRVGLTDESVPIGYKFVLLAMIPVASNPSNEAIVRKSISSMVKKFAANLLTEIDSLPVLETSTAKPNEDLEKRLTNHTSEIQKRMNDKFSAAFRDFPTSVAPSFPRFGISLALALRPCVGTACSLRTTGKHWFSRLYDWTYPPGLKVNQAYIVNSKGSFVPVTALLDKGLGWHRDFSKYSLGVSFENAAKESRQKKVALSYPTARLVGLSKENLAHLADVFDFPYAAAFRLPSDPKQKLTAGISDEIARARLRDCVRLRGLFDPQEAGECAGFSVTLQDLTFCLAGKYCMPAFGDKVNLETIMVPVNASVSSVAHATNLPRINLGKAETVVQIANKCQEKGSSETGACLLKETVGRDPKGSRIIDCVQAAEGSSTALADCASLTLSEDQRRQIECFRANSKNSKALALCASDKVLPPAAQKMLACADKFKQTTSGYAETVDCLKVVKASREAKCLLSYRDNWADAALCMGEKHIPPQVQSAVSCATHNSTSIVGFGVCMVASEATGEAQRIAMCYAEAQGVPAAVAVCLAAKDLNQDQRIVLECAAATNGALPATAACVAGKMVMKEMVNCKGKKFGEGSCFNENNEIRKFAKSAGAEIGPQSVVGQAINVELQYLQFIWKPMLYAGEEALPKLMKFVNEKGLIPDPKKPLSWFVPPAVAAGKDFCRHNECDPRKFFHIDKW